MKRIFPAVLTLLFAVGCRYVPERTLVCSFSPDPAREGSLVTATLRIANNLPVPIILDSLKLRAERSPMELLYRDRIVWQKIYPGPVECTSTSYLPHAERLILRFKRKPGSEKGEWLLLPQRDYQHIKILLPGQEIVERCSFQARYYFRKYLRAEIYYLRLDSEDVKARLFRRLKTPELSPEVKEYAVAYAPVSRIEEKKPAEKDYIFYLPIKERLRALRVWRFRLPIRVKQREFPYRKAEELARAGPKEVLYCEALSAWVFEYEDGTWFLQADRKRTYEGHYVELCKALDRENARNCILIKKVTPDDPLLAYFKERGYAELKDDTAVVNFPVSELLDVLRRAEELDIVVYPFSWGRAERLP